MGTAGKGEAFPNGGAKRTLRAQSGEQREIFRRSSSEWLSNRVAPRKTSPFVPVEESTGMEGVLCVRCLVGLWGDDIMAYQRPRGTVDLLPGETDWWENLETVARRLFRAYHFQEIRTPVFEHTEVFVRSVGETTDIVEKEMYTFPDKKGRSMTLRPEGTAGVIRAYVENKLYANPGVSKLYYVGPMFRYENPQAGRQRQFYQLGCEALGADGPDIDAEIIALSVDVLHEFGLEGVSVELNSVGCPVCRAVHKERMLEALDPVRDKLCSDCSRRIDKNPLRIFDCKRGCQAVLEEVGAPTILDSLCSDCRHHFEGTKALLDAFEVRYEVNPLLVRGLDYYTRTAWELTYPGSGSLGGGGRYNGLVEQLDGPPTPGIGFAIGMERAILMRKSNGGEPSQKSGLDVFVAVADKAAAITAQKFVHRLRKKGIRADKDYQGKGMKAQFKAADRERARFVAVFGGDELLHNTVSIKDLSTGVQQEIPEEEAIQFLTNQARQEI